MWPICWAFPLRTLRLEVVVIGLTLRALVGYPTIRTMHWEALVAVGVLRHPLGHGVPGCTIATILVLRGVAPTIASTIAPTIASTVPKLFTLQLKA